MKCYECKWLDRSVVLTSIPPQYNCTLGFGSHYADHECEYEFVPIVRCEDCRFYTGDRQYCENDHFCRPDSFCSYGEREESKVEGRKENK